MGENSSAQNSCYPILETTKISKKTALSLFMLWLLGYFDFAISGKDMETLKYYNFDFVIIILWLNKVFKILHHLKSVFQFLNVRKTPEKDWARQETECWQPGSQYFPDAQ